MRLVDADVVKEVLRYRVSESIDECINNVPTVDVLNKIRAEIEYLNYLSIEDGSDGYDKYIDRQDVIEIIDKYTAESKDKE